MFWTFAHLCYIIQIIVTVSNIWIKVLGEKWSQIHLFLSQDFKSYYQELWNCFVLDSMKLKISKYKETIELEHWSTVKRVGSVFTHLLYKQIWIYLSILSNYNISIITTLNNKDIHLISYLNTTLFLNVSFKRGESFWSLFLF